MNSNRAFRLSLIAIAVLALVLGAAWYFKQRPMAGSVTGETALEHAAKHMDPSYVCPMHPQVVSDKPGLCPICGMPLVKNASARPVKSERKVLYWYDPMKPEVHFDQPGKSPFMDMQLLPKYATDEPAQADLVSIDPRMVQSLGVRTAPVESYASTATMDALGLVQHDENRVATVTLRSDGYIERLYVRAQDDPVRKGQLLMEIYSPELLAAQEEYLLARAMDAQSAAAARERLRVLGISRAQIDALDGSGSAKRHIAVYAPMAGVVKEVKVRQGMRVSMGESAFEIVDLSSVWVIAELTEKDSVGVRVGARGEIRLPALPGQVFKAKVDYVYPELNQKSRTLRVRMKLANSNGELKPQMLANVSFASGAEKQRLRVPSEAVIATGKRNYVILAEAEGKFRPVEIETGTEADGKTDVLRGLQAGQQVVASGQFLIDSEANIRGALKRFEPARSEAQPAGSR